MSEIPHLHLALSAINDVDKAKCNVLMDDIIGRKNELSVLKSLITSKKSEFVAVYGRRRVGKTFLIRSAFDERFTFNVTALGNAKLVQQLANFHIALKKEGCPTE